MTPTRIFVSSKISSGIKLILDEFGSRHVINALRLKINDPIQIFNDADGEFEAVITSIEKNKATVLVKSFCKQGNESSLQINLVQGVSRGDKMDFTIQKSVELGVHSITAVFTELCNVKLKNERLKKKLQHWQRVAISAAEQSGRCSIPKIYHAESVLSFFKENNSPSELNLILDPHTKNTLKTIENTPKNTTIIIGPEGGFSDKELTLAKENDFTPIKLGPRILRTETAGLATISALQTSWGDF